MHTAQRGEEIGLERESQGRRTRLEGCGLELKIDQAQGPYIKQAQRGARQFEVNRCEAMIEVMRDNTQVAHHMALIGVFEIVMTERMREQCKLRSQQARYQHRGVARRHPQR